MLNVFNSYERTARIYPALIISLPVIITSYCFSILYNISVAIKISINSPIILATLMLLSNIVRHFGKEVEPKKWNEWGGPPSTRFLRKKDNHFTQETKKLLYQRILKNTGIDLEKDDSDKRISQAFAIIRNILRDKKSKGLWLKFNQEYGFLRNLLGSRLLWVVLSFTSSGICFFTYIKIVDKLDLIWIGGLLNLIIAFAAIGCGWFVFPKLIKNIAERYAEDALISYLNLDN